VLPSCLACGGDGVARVAAAHAVCRRCGFAFALVFDLSIVARVYAEQRASGRRERIEAHRVPLFRALLERYARLPGRRCLDVGCGAGTFVRLAADLGWSATGVDPEAPAADRRRARFIRSAFPAPEVAARAPFDLVTFLNSLNYFADPVAALREAHRLLEPGGLVVVRVPNGRVHQVLARATGALIRVPVVGTSLARARLVHPRAFSARSLRLALARAGFVRVGVEGTPTTGGDPDDTGTTMLRLAKALAGPSTLALARASGERILVTPSLLATGTRA
jgi:2-polyprenyl-3-methyl-5-hydroxy-6-metoxy-1,4-benzoquinol methylase